MSEVLSMKCERHKVQACVQIRDIHVTRFSRVVVGSEAL